MADIPALQAQNTEYKLHGPSSRIVDNQSSPVDLRWSVHHLYVERSSPLPDIREQALSLYPQRRPPKRFGYEASEAQGATGPVTTDTRRGPSRRSLKNSGQLGELRAKLDYEERQELLQHSTTMLSEQDDELSMIMVVTNRWEHRLVSLFSPAAALRQHRTLQT